MSKVLESDAVTASDDAYVQLNFSPALTDVYISFDYYVTAAAKAGISAGSFASPFMFILGGVGHNNQLQGIYSYFNTTDLIWDVWNGFVGNQWPSDGIGWGADTWHTIQVRLQKSTDQITFKIDGTTYGPFSEAGGWASGGIDANTVIIGQFTPGFGTPVREVIYFDNVKVGTTALGSFDVFSDDFESGGITNWTTSFGNVSVIDDPFTGPVVYADANTFPVKVSLVYDEGLDDGKLVPVIATPSGVDLSQFVESSVVRVSVSFSGVDCYNIATPNYEITDFKRWETEEGLKRWGTDEAGKRWSLVEVIGAFDNECRGL